MPFSLRFAVSLFSTLATLAPLAVQAQRKAKNQPGYVVTTAGDTLRGLLTVPQFVTADGVTLRATPGAKAQHIAPAQLRSVGLQDGRRFVKRALTSSLNPETGQTDSATVVLQQLVGGAVGFYRYDHSLARYNGQNHFLEAQRVQYFVETARGSLVPVRRTTYQATLPVIFQNCPPVTETIARTGFDEIRLSDLALRYDTLCQPAVPATDYRLPRIPNPIRLLLSVRLSAQHSTLSYSASDYLPAEQSRGAVRPDYGLEVRFANNSAWSLISGLHYATQHSELTRQQPAQLGTTNAGEQLPLPATVDTRQLQLPVLLRYTLGRARLQPYVAAGLLLGYYLRDEASVSYTTLTYVGGSSTYYRNDVITMPVRPSDPMRDNLGKVLRLGVQLKTKTRFSPLLELQYSAGQDRGHNQGPQYTYIGTQEDIGRLRYRVYGFTAGLEF